MSSATPSRENDVDNDDDEFAQLRRYVLEGPFAPDHPGVIAAVRGIDQEVQRRERDARLAQKFAAVTNSNNHNDHNAAVNSSSSLQNINMDDDDDAVKIEKPFGVGTTTTREAAKDTEQDAMMTDDWHDVTVEDDIRGKMEEHESSSSYFESFGATKDGSNTNSSTCFLGDRLGREVVAAIAAHNVGCATPLGAIAVALHATLLLRTCGFACTGLVPSSAASAAESASSAGFAPPVRALPPSQFLPLHWEAGGSSSNEIQLRYRKEGQPVAMVLTVTAYHSDATGGSTGSSGEVDKIRILFAPQSASEPMNPLMLDITEHFNLASWQRALKGSRLVPPVLHYKALSTLLTKFVLHFDLGSIPEDGDNNDDEEACTNNSSTFSGESTKRQADGTTTTTTTAAGISSTYVDYTMLQGQQKQHHVHPAIAGGDGPFLTYPIQPHDPLRLGSGRGSALNHPTIPLGDFSGDLMPTGIHPYPGGLPQNPGSLMGPSHPAFLGGEGAGIGMTPRFDPFGPPGGPTEPEDPDNILNNRRPHHPSAGRIPGGTGNPNNDLEQPPSLGSNNNMFL
jgi:hypothetical protein